MALYPNRVPYTDLHTLNLDWVLETLKKLETEWESYGTQATATAHESAKPEVTISGNFKTVVNFDFGLVSGKNGIDGAIFTPNVNANGDLSWTNNQGKPNPPTVNVRGPQGVKGEQGPAGSGLYILDTYPTLAALQQAHPTGTPGDAYLVGSNNNFILYVWSASTNAWANAGSLSSPSPSGTLPQMDSVASQGTENRYSRGDHTHPSDTSKLDKQTNDGTYTEVYAFAGNVQNKVKITDEHTAGYIAMYDQVSGNLNTGTPVGEADCVRKVDLDAKQDKLVSGTNIKTINGQSILGSGNVETGARLQDVYPIGSVYLSVDNVNPNVRFGFGTWQLISSKMATGENVYGNGKALKLTDGTSLAGMFQYNTDNGLSTGVEWLNSDVGTTTTNSTRLKSQTVVGVATKTQLASAPSGLVLDTMDIYMWKRTA